MKTPKNTTKHYFKKTVRHILNEKSLQIVRKRLPNENIILISPTLEEKLKKYHKINNYKIDEPNSQIQCKYKIDI